MNAASVDLITPLRKQFGHEQFRPGQEPVIRALLAGKDVLAVLPTGAGKSLVYQLTAQLLPGVTLVVSPLLSLMKDQADSIEERGIEVSVVNSLQSEGQADREVEKVERGEAKLLYVTPERFGNAEFLEEMKALNVALLVVDEAHCVSQWGYDFRSAYLALADVAEEIGRPPILALTATATPWVRRDLVERLGLRNPEIVIHGVDRPNLFFEVLSVRKEEQDDYRRLRSLFLEPDERYPAELAAQLRGTMQGSGIIYCATTRAAQETAKWLNEWEIPADYYHGQRKKSDRERVQEQFMSGELWVIAATNAFGLGIDKPDVRFVIHRNVPASVEAYYQEAGRAGRDGEFSRCLLLYRSNDLGRAAFLSASATLAPADLKRLRAALLSRAVGAEISFEELAAATKLGKVKLHRLADLLEGQGLVEMSPTGVRLLTPEVPVDTVSLEGEESRREYERSRLQMMRSYAEHWECRRRFLLAYFGDEHTAEKCGRCDCDAAQDRRGEEETQILSFPVGATVTHPQWGQGQVTQSGEETITVAFAEAGEKKLATELVRERDFLTLVAEPTKEAPCETVSAPEPFQVGDAVLHSEYGEGEIQGVNADRLTVLFTKHGFHTLDRNLVLGKGLLRLALEQAGASSPASLPA